MKQSLFILLTIISFHGLYSQIEISGFIFDKNKSALQFAEILLKTADGQSILKYSNTDEKGEFSFINEKGKYTIEVNYLGYKKYTETLKVGNDKVNLKIVLEEDEVALDEVAVKAERLAIERKIDRTVVNIKNSASLAGNSLLSVIEKSPGMAVNRQSGSISMSGKEGVVVMINNKVQYLQGNGLIDFLNGLSSEKVDKLELLSTPPANLDAEGNAGYINIIMSRSENEGLSGNYSLVAGGYKGINTGADLSLNYKNKNFSFFGSTGIIYNTQTQDFRFFRDIEESSNLVSHRTYNDRNPIRTNANAMLGFEYKWKKINLYTTFNGYRNNWDMLSSNNTTITRNGVQSEKIESELSEINLWKHFGINSGLDYKINNKNSLSMNIDILNYITENPTNYENSYFATANNSTSHSKIKSDKETPIAIRVGKVDYKNEISSKVSLEAGVKASIAGFINDISVSGLDNNVWVTDPMFTNKSTLDENIFAAYQLLQFSITQKLNFKGGLRYEYTDTHIKDAEKTTVLHRKYGNVFPSIFLNYSINETSSLGLSYSARITRPTFNNLAPFVIFTDPNSFTTGNINLLPTTSKTIKVEWKRKSLFTSLQYSNENNIIAMFIPQTSGQNTTIYKTRNFDRNKILSSTISYPITLTKKWNTIFNLTANIQQIKGMYNDNNVTINQKYGILFMINRFSLPSKINFEITSMLNTGGMWGAYRNKAFGFLNFGFQKQLANSSTIIVAFDNVLNTMLFRSNFTDTYSGNVFNNRMIFARPTASLTFRKSFGNDKVKGKKNAVSEERSRVE